MKPLKSGYIDKSLNLRAPLTETVYHISKNENSGLYMQTAIRKGQYFSGTISGKGMLITPVYEIMKNGVIRVGRSKTAQYSACEILPAAFYVSPKTTDTVKINKGEGFGFVKILKSADLAYIQQSSPDNTEQAVNNGVFSKAVMLEKTRNDALNYAAKTDCKLNGSQLGIAMLMARNSRRNQEYLRSAYRLVSFVGKRGGRRLFLVKNE